MQKCNNRYGVGRFSREEYKRKCTDSLRFSSQQSNENWDQFTCFFLSDPIVAAFDLASQVSKKDLRNIANARIIKCDETA